jgi:hypothetical protein
MTARVGTILVTAVAIIIAWGNLAAIYVAISFGCIGYMLHVLEVKINKLLDHHRITVRDKDID